MAGSGPGGKGDCLVYGKAGHQYFSKNNHLECACGAKVFKDKTKG